MKKQFLEEGTVSTLPHTDARRNEANPVGPHLQRHRWEARRFFCIFTLAVEEMATSRLQLLKKILYMISYVRCYFQYTDQEFSVKKGPG